MVSKVVFGRRFARSSGGYGVFPILLAPMLLGLLIGCGQSNVEPTNTDEIANSLANISDALSNPEKLNALFVAGSEPDAAWRKESQKYTMIVSGADVDGDSATVNVDLEENMSGNIAGTVQWECERVDGEWKIKTAPLQ